MANRLFNKPENALKRATEYINIGNKSSALNLLHEVLSFRKPRTWQKSYETVMLKYIDLCVELRDPIRGKDGLHQYRNMSQAQAPGSLEVVVTHFIDLAESRLAKAADTAEAAALREAERMTDIEQAGTPESVMLSTMTDDSDRKRTDRQILIPWLLFLWETYRSVLDILKTNSKLELVYHNTAARAFAFCEKYKRRLEFRRLCDLLRLHLSNLQKYASGPNAANDKRLKVWDGWTDESIELHLQTRFRQLETTAKLELWTEGFKTVEDIHGIMQINKKAPKARVMAMYYEKLQRIFWVSENYLFHAYAWFKYFTLSESHNKGMTNEERTELASCVLLAAMSIPGLEDQAVGAEKAFDDSTQSTALIRNQHMASLLGFHAHPARTHLMGEIMSRKLLDLVLPEVREMYENLEKRFQPLDLVKAMLPSLDFCRKHERLSQYIKPISRLVVLRLLRQLSSVYHTVKISQLLDLLSGLNFEPNEVEKMIVVAVKAKQIQARLDHGKECLKFGDVVLESDNMRRQLTTLSSQLQTVVALVQPTGAVGVDEDKAKARARFFEVVRENMEKEHSSTLNRKNTIERRKEELERRREEQREIEQRQLEQQEILRAQQEKRRMELAARERERIKRVEMEKKMRELETKMELEKLGIDTAKVDLGSSETDKLISEAQKQAEKAENQEETRRRDQAKRLDYITRAMRAEEAPLVRTKHDERLEEEREAHENSLIEFRRAAEEAYTADVALKGQLQALIDKKGPFESEILAERAAAHERRVAELRRDAYYRKIARARQRKAEKEEEEEAAEMERQRRAEAEEEAARHAEEEAERRAEEEAEAARRAEEEAEAEKRHQERLRQAEQDRKDREQRELEREAEDREKREQEAQKPPPSRDEPTSWRAAPRDPAPPARNDGDGEGSSWRRTGPPPAPDGERGGWRSSGRGRSLADMDSGDSSAPPSRMGSGRPNQDRENDGPDGGGSWSRGSARFSDAPPPRREREPRPSERGSGADSGRWR
uniref:Eukaryotic translation initiation factor 3 subunit A n=1 Tax=Rhizochromulina marina TaxID=1034831 RepID=A0A7S2R6Z3_9STRA